jgi:Extended Signal Peptide of Type V secretion system
MNKSYRSIWNEALGAWVAASEISSARGKPKKSSVVVAGVVVLALGLPTLAFAGPVAAPTTTAGTGTVSDVTIGGTTYGPFAGADAGSGAVTLMQIGGGAIAMRACRISQLA